MKDLLNLFNQQRQTLDFVFFKIALATEIHTLSQVEGNKSEAARRLGVTRRTLHLKLKKYGLME